MSAQNGSTPSRTEPAHDQAVIAVTALLLRAERHERDGLSPSCAVLTAAAELGIDAAAVLAFSHEAAA